MNKSIPIDQAGRLVIPKEVRRRLQLRAGDHLEVEVGADAIILRPRRAAPAGLVHHRSRMVWEVPGAVLTESDVDQALARGRAERDRRASGGP